MATATAPSAWVAAALRKPVSREDLIHELAVALEDEIVGHPEVKEAQAKVHAGLDRFAKLDEALADEIDLDDLVLMDFYCAVVRATLAAVLARSEGTVAA